ncbi:hypothetical protein VOLCADRAFT_121781 [Volvox carteri f. nagariensis]|uniref:MIR domain-containing protein n=1 Tax=Volvox carteri f. nagariensis TaxID=3068 RepID=D8UKJ4_VOLCA|nr:uncharacterized protein VOLCADRAFT_121781 [Volvox carteri f. nagariensis]EFJ39749.1 hypothetical protein VOLCADRAFT_121781 [Volvox carteri f. nagariensis]|eukprot:XP_002959187.1 hypothetical protein VOLCADRAFT_121781 [Volvox carteri f. nagariensis]
MEDLATRCLKYGDVIYLKTDGKQAFVSAQDRSTPQVRTEELADGADSPPDLKDCLFEVTKKYQYTQKKSLVLELTRNGVVPEEALASDSVSGFGEVLSATIAEPKLRQKLILLFDAYQREQRTNRNEFRQVVGESVLYGQVIQLRHVPTGKFVTIKRTAADVERGALKVVLEEGGQEGSWFQVFSGYRTKPEGGKLMPGEVVAFKGLAFSGNGLHVSAGDVRDPAMLPVDRHPYVTAFKEVCASPDVTSFKDLVANTVYINFLGAINDKFLYFQNPLTRPEPNRIGGPDCWRLELVAEGGFWSGMPLSHGCTIRIRHLATGTYLAALSSKAKEAARAWRARKAALATGPGGAGGGGPGGEGAPAGAGGEFGGGAGAAAAAAAVSGGGGGEMQNVLHSADEDVLYDEAFRLVLTKRYGVPDTLWELHTFTKEEMLGAKVYAFFKHVTTQFWLSGAGPPIPAQPSEDPDDPQPAAAAVAGAANAVRHPPGAVRQDRDPNWNSLLLLVRLLVLLVRQMLRPLAPLLVVVLVVVVVVVVVFSDWKVRDYRRVVGHQAEFAATTPQQQQQQLAVRPLRASVSTTVEEQMYPVVHPEKLERNVMLVVKVPEEFTSKISDLSRVMSQLKDLRHVLNKEKIPPEQELLELVAKGQEAEALARMADTQYPDKFRQRYPALNRSLKDLVRWMDKNTWSEAADAASPHLEYQALLRELGLIDLLVQYMDAARVRLFATSGKLRGTRLGGWVVESGKRCHRILQLCCQGNELNQAYLSKYAAMVMSHLSSPLTAPDTLAAMYEDNMAQMQTVSPAIVAASNWIVADIVGPGRHPLQVFCRAGLASRPGPEGQMRQTWVIRCLRNDDPGQEVAVDAAEFSSIEEDLSKRSIKEWDLSSEETAYSPRELFIYYCFSLKFIVSLCYGRNSLARDQILRASAKYGLGLEFDALQKAVTNKALPYSMRTYMVQVLRALYVDIEPYQTLKLPRHIRLMSKKGAIRVSLKTNPNSETINTLIRTVLEQLRLATTSAGGAGVETGAAATGGGGGGGGGDGGDKEDDGGVYQPAERGERTVGRNTLVLNYLKMVHEMFHLGMMDLDSGVTQEVLAVLLDIIQKLDSMPLDKPARFQRSYTSKVVMQAKKVALATIDFALDMKSEQQCAAVFDRFAQWQRSPERLAKVHAQISRMGNATISGLRVLGASVRAVATLTTTAANKVLPTPGTSRINLGAMGMKGAGGDMEAPPPREDSGEGDGEMIRRSDGPERWAEEAADALAADNEDGDFPLFKLDTIRDTEPLYVQAGSPIMKMFDLVRYDDQELTARTFQLVERLTSKREKLLEELMRTFVVTDDELIALAAWAIKQVETAQHAYNYMGSLDPSESRDACAKAARAIDALTSLLIPLQHVTVSTGIMEGEEGEGEEKGGQPERIFVSKTTAANCQYLMFDLQIHLMVLKFLKLPLKRKHQSDARKIQIAEDPSRQNVFRACLLFLRHFMVVGDLETPSANVSSHANQRAVLPSLELLLSFLDTHGLPASDTVIALFINNLADAATEGEKVIRKLIKLITRYGDKKHAGWLELLGKVMVVNGNPIKRNQMVAMQLITQYGEDTMLLLSGDAGLDELRKLLASERLTAKANAVPPLLADCCVGKEPELVVKASGYMSLPQVLDVLLLQPSQDAPESNLRYVQRAYWRLLQHCYFATDTDNTKVQVRNGANRIWPLAEVEADGGAAGGEGGGDGGGELAAATSVLLQRFLDLPGAGEESSKNRAGGAVESCLMQAVLEEVKRALADPSDALANADSATFFLVTSVFPALKDYFEHHWHSHLPKLHTTPIVLLEDLFNNLMDLFDALKRLKDVANSQAVKAEIKLAITNTRALLSAMPPEANTADRTFETHTTGGGGRGGGLGPTAANTGRSLVSFADGGGGPNGGGSAPSTSQHTALTATSQKLVQRDWMQYLRALSERVSVEINLRSYEVVEVSRPGALVEAIKTAASSLGMGEGDTILEQASLLRLARILAARYGRRVPGTSPPMCFEVVVEMLCKLLGGRSGRPGESGAVVVGGGGGGGVRGGVGPTGWKPALLVKMVRAVCAAAVLDDGAGAEDGDALRNAWASLGLLRDGGKGGEVVSKWQPPSLELLTWRQCKYDKLGATRAAVTLLAHPMPEVQLEALKVLEVLLQSGNQAVQATIYDILKDGSELTDAVFANFKAAFDRCRKYVTRRVYVRNTRAIKSRRKDVAEEAKKAVTGAVKSILSGGSRVAGAAGGLGLKAVKLVAAAPSELGTLGSMVAASGDHLMAVASKGLLNLQTAGSGDLQEQEEAAAAAAAGGGGGGAGMGERGSRGNSGVLAAVPEDGTPEERQTTGAHAFTPSTGDVGGGGEEEEEDEEEVRWEDKSAKLNNADNAYEFTKVLLNVLKSMVEGHYKNLQHVLQLQPHSTSSMDLVVEAVDLLNVLQGPCSSNQQSLAGTNFLASCNRIFGCIGYSAKHVPRPDDRSGEDRKISLNMCNVKSALLNLLASLLEACPSEDVPGRCSEILDFGVVDRQIGRLCSVLGMAGTPPRYPADGEDVADCDPEVPEEAELINISSKLEDELLLFCSYILKLHSVTPSRPPPLPYIWALHNGAEVDKMDELTPEQQLYAGELQAFLQRRLGYVEINWRGQLVEPFFFKLTPECSNLVTSKLWCDVTLDRINNTVSPDSRAFPTVKAAELVEVLEDVVDDIELESRLGRNRWLKAVSIMAQYRMRLLELTFYLAVGTLIFQALADARWSPHTSFQERGENWATIVLSVAVMLQSTCTILLYTSFVYTELNKYMSHGVPKTIAAMNQLAGRMREIFTYGSGGGGGGGQPRGGGGVGAENEEEVLDQGVFAARELGLPPPPLNRRRGWGDFFQLAAAVVATICRYAKFWYFNMLVSASLAGFFVSPFFLVFHFTIYFLDFDSGKQLVMAIQRSGMNILNTFVLAVLAIYTFAVVTFLVFQEPTTADKGDGPPCDTFYQCMGAHMLTGIMGDISNLFNSDLWDTVPSQVGEDGLQQARTLFVLFFFMIWNFVLSNIFVGLIASAFEAIRDDQNTITSDRLSKCLICSQDMYLFNEKIQGGFEEHIIKQHNALSYVFFLHHLRATAPEDYTGTESVVRAVLDSAKTSTDKGTWLPVSKSLAVMHATAAAAAAASGGAGGAGSREAGPGGGPSS